MLGSVSAPFTRCKGSVLVVYIGQNFFCRNEATGGWRAVRLANGALYQPEKGWQGLVFVVVLATTKGDAAAQNTEGVEVSVAHPEEEYAAGAPPSSSDSGKRKLEDQEGPRASKNPRSQSPENYVRQNFVSLQILVFVLCNTYYYKSYINPFDTITTVWRVRNQLHFLI